MRAIEMLPRVVLEPIEKERATVLRNLMEFYAHDFSEHVALELNESGRFEVTLGDEWWTDGHYPFFIRCDQKLCGFALARRGSKFTEAADVMDVAEFFVIRGARKQGVGASAARILFGTFPGAWEIRVRQSNEAALEFWSRVVEEWSGRAVTSARVCFGGGDWNVLRIEAER